MVRDSVQIFTFFVILASLIIKIRLFKLQKEKRIMLIPYFMVLVHAFFFYAAILFRPAFLDSIQYGDWSSILRAHTFGIMLAVSIYRYIAEKEKRRYSEHGREHISRNP